MGALVQFQLTFTTLTCCECGIEFAVSTRFETELLRVHRSFFCPNGHSQYFTAESDRDKAARLERELSATRVRLFDQQRKLTNAMTKATRLRKRLAAGVCPCCHRSFVALSRHMQQKHPGYAKADPT